VIASQPLVKDYENIQDGSVRSRNSIGALGGGRGVGHNNIEKTTPLPSKADILGRRSSAAQPPLADSYALGGAPTELNHVQECNSAFGNMKILVADDNRVNVEVVTKMLKLENVHDVTVARVSFCSRRSNLILGIGMC
jgi:hypothetical protein